MRYRSSTAPTSELLAEISPVPIRRPLYSRPPTEKTYSMSGAVPTVVGSSPRFFFTALDSDRTILPCADGQAASRRRSRILYRIFPAIAHGMNIANRAIISHPGIRNGVKTTAMPPATSIAAKATLRLKGVPSVRDTERFIGPLVPRCLETLRHSIGATHESFRQIR